MSRDTHGHSQTFSGTHGAAMGFTQRSKNDETRLSEEQERSKNMSHFPKKCFCCNMSRRDNHDLECPVLRSKNSVGNVDRNGAVKKTYETDSLELNKTCK